MLELYADHVKSPEHEVFLAEITAPPFPRLRYAKLFGHIPRTFAAWILRSGATLQRLELGMVDRLLSGNDFPDDSPHFRPLPEENLLLNRSLENNDPGDSSDYGSLDGEYLIPRPLGGFLPASISGSNRSQTECSLSRLKQLYLPQPSMGKYDDESPPIYSWSTRADKACLADWRQILLTANQTLEVLVLEQRPGVEDTEADSLSYFMTYDEEGTGSQTFVSMMEDILNINGSFSKLRNVYLHGMSMGADPAWHEFESESEEKTDPNQVPGRRLLERFQQRGICCEASVSGSRAEIR